MQTQQEIPSMNKKCGNISCSPTAVNDKKVNSKMYNEFPKKKRILNQIPILWNLRSLVQL